MYSLTLLVNVLRYFAFSIFVKKQHKNLKKILNNESVRSGDFPKKRDKCADNPKVYSFVILSVENDLICTELVSSSGYTSLNTDYPFECKLETSGELFAFGSENKIYYSFVINPILFRGLSVILLSACNSAKV